MSNIDFSRIITAADKADRNAEDRIIELNAERDRRIKAGFVFQGVWYDFDAVSKARVTGAATLAGFAMGAGAQAGNYFWANPSEGFAWIATDNSVVPMDAPTCFAFGQAAAAHESAHVFAAFALKALGVPEDFADDTYWP